MENNKDKGYKRKKGNRWHISYGFGETGKGDLDYGFKSKAEFENWLKEQVEKRGLDWRTGFVWKFRDSKDEYRLCNKVGMLAQR